MTIETDKILAAVLASNGITNGTYSIKSKKSAFSLLMGDYYESGYSVIGSITLADGKIKSCSCDLAALLQLTISNMAIFEPEAKKYFYFDDSLVLMTKNDEGSQQDKDNKDSHNYFDCSEIGRDDLSCQFADHIRNMRLNLLSTFHPQYD